MKNKIYIGISLAILAIGGYFVYNKLTKKPNRSKEESIAIIVSNGYSANKDNLLSTFEEAFLNEWSYAITKNQKTFSYKGKEYNTQGGTSVKK